MKEQTKRKIKEVESKPFYSYWASLFPPSFINELEIEDCGEGG